MLLSSLFIIYKDRVLRTQITHVSVTYRLYSYVFVSIVCAGMGEATFRLMRL